MPSSIQMRCRLLSFLFLITLLGSTGFSRPACAQNEPKGFLDFNFTQGRQADTQRMIDVQNRGLEAGDRSTQTIQDTLSRGRSRAQEMVNLIKDEELQKALVKVTARGKQILQENSDLKNPLGVIAGAASLWYGKTIRLMRADQFLLTTRIEGRGRSGEFSMESPLVNGRLRYNGGDGVNIMMNRKISSIDSQAEFNFNMNNQSFSTSVRHTLTPNLDLTFGASQTPLTNQTDGRAAFEYRLDF